jgi:hypothetical protein
MVEGLGDGVGVPFGTGVTLLSAVVGKGVTVVLVGVAVIKGGVVTVVVPVGAGVVLVVVTSARVVAADVGAVVSEELVVTMEGRVVATVVRTGAVVCGVTGGGVMGVGVGCIAGCSLVVTGTMVGEGSSVGVAVGSGGVAVGSGEIVSLICPVPTTVWACRSGRFTSTRNPTAKNRITAAANPNTNPVLPACVITPAKAGSGLLRGCSGFSEAILTVSGVFGSTIFLRYSDRPVVIWR